VTRTSSPPNRAFWLLDGRTGWRTGAREGVTVGARSGIRLAAAPDGPLAATSPDGSLGGLRLPAGMAFDEHATLHLLDREQRAVRVFDAERARFRALLTEPPPGGPYPCAADGDPGEPGDPRTLRAPLDIAIAGHDLYVADFGIAKSDGRVLVFDLRTLALTRLWGPGTWKPTALAARGRTAWILDTGGRKVLRHRAGSERLEHLASIPDDGWELAGLAVDVDERTYVLSTRHDDGRVPRLLVFGPDGRPESVPDDPGDLRDRFDSPPIVLDDTGRFCIPPELAEPCGRRVPAEPPRAYAPLARCTPSHGLVFDRHGDPVALEPPGRAGPALYGTRGMWRSHALDSELYRCQWHRIVLDLAALPPGTRLVASTYADEHDDPERAATVPEDLWVTRHEIVGGEQPLEASDAEFLVQSRGGRYLWIRLDLYGDGYATPAVRAIRAEFPRQSYLDFLPAIYSADDDSRWFLERFLSVFQTELEELEDRLREVTRLFDPQAAPAGEELDWLAAVLGLPIEGRWQPEQRRPLVVAAREVAPRRGTLAGVRRYLRAYLESMTGVSWSEEGWPAVVEGYRERALSQLSVGTGTRLGDSPPLWSAARAGRLQLGVNAREGQVRLISTGAPRRDPFDEHAHRFRAFVPAAWVRSAAAEGMVRRALDAEKPAHTAYDLCLVEPRFRVGVQSTVGLDTIVAVRPVATLACGCEPRCARGPEQEPAPSLPPRRRLGFDTVLACRPEAAVRLGGGLRAGLGAELT
jgi:phage tail-like protein